MKGLFSRIKKKKEITLHRLTESEYGKMGDIEAKNVLGDPGMQFGVKVNLDLWVKALLHQQYDFTHFGALISINEQFDVHPLVVVEGNDNVLERGVTYVGGEDYIGRGYFPSNQILHSKFFDNPSPARFDASFDGKTLYVTVSQVPSRETKDSKWLEVLHTVDVSTGEWKYSNLDDLLSRVPEFRVDEGLFCYTSIRHGSDDQLYVAYKNQVVRTSFEEPEKGEVLSKTFHRPDQRIVKAIDVHEGTLYILYDGFRYCKESIEPYSGRAMELHTFQDGEQERRAIDQGQHPSEIENFTVRPHHNQIWMYNHEGIHVYDMEERKITQKIPFQSKVEDLTFYKNGMFAYILQFGSPRLGQYEVK